MSYKIRSICIKVVPVAIFLLFLQPAGAQGWNKLGDELAARQKQLGNNFVFLLWKDDTVAFKKELGDFNSKTQAPLADASQWLTAALVMVMADEGKISLDDKVSRYLPVFERYGKNYITLRNCLSHMTGIEEGRKLFQKKKFASLEEEVNAFAAKEIRANPGEDFWYGDTGIDIAARVLEVVSKKRFDVLIKQKLFNPLTMRRTTFSTLDASAVNPSSGALSTPDDYLQFLVMLLGKGKYKGKQVISEESIHELLRVQTKPGQLKYVPQPATGFSYTLGAWALEENEGIATALANPGLSGTWPVVDFCRGYAYLFFIKQPMDEQKATVQIYLKEMIDKQLTSACR